ncbi:MAG: MXAN_6640 family putative metalloprotease [bacterium]
MKKNIAVIILFLSASIQYSQNLDSLFKAFVQLRTESHLTERPARENHDEVMKCSFPLVCAVRLNYNKFSNNQQQILTTLLMRPESDTSIVSPKGLFRIHYRFTDGAPGYNITLLAVAFDSVYNYEINKLGYIAPPDDNGLGGDDLYDVYVYNIGNTYGWTNPEIFLDDGLWAGHIVLDNDFDGFYTTGIEAARVTAAHEFHHLVQMGNYILSDKDSFYHEITSVSMEEFVFDAINDYYGYMRAYFNNPSSSISNTVGFGYDLAIWNIFLKDRFGVDIIKKIWEEMKQLGAMNEYYGKPVALKATEKVLLSISTESTSLKNELNKFGIWAYFTGPRAEAGKNQNAAFEEAEYYPLIRTSYLYEFEPPQKSMMVISEPVSNNFLIFYDYSQSLPDTLVCLITNGNVDGTQANPPVETDFNFTLRSDQPSDFTKITDRFSSKFESANTSLFQQANIFNTFIVSGDFEREAIDYAYPNPFSYKKHLDASNVQISIPVEPNINGLTQLQVYTTSMQLVYSERKSIIPGERIIIRWNGLDNSGNKLPTGVYIYVTEAGDEIKTGKIVIYNE